MKQLKELLPLIIAFVIFLMLWGYFSYKHSSFRVNASKHIGIIYALEKDGNHYDLTYVFCIGSVLVKNTEDTRHPPEGCPTYGNCIGKSYQIYVDPDDWSNSVIDLDERINIIDSSEIRCALDYIKAESAQRGNR